MKTIFVLYCKIRSDSSFLALEKQINFNLQILRLFPKFHMIGSQALLEWRITYLKEAVSRSLILPSKGFSEFPSLQSTSLYPTWERQILCYVCIV